MIVALAYSYAEQDQVGKLLDWICSQGSYPNHTLVLGVEKRVTERFIANTMASFADVVEFDFVDHMEHFPESKNLAFQQCALWIQSFIPEAKRFLYIESDAVPLNSSWLDRIEAEMKAGGKAFVGPLVPAVPTHRSPAHMGTVAVYPVDMVKAGAGEAMIATEQPFPAAIAGVTTRGMMVSKLIVEDWEGTGIPPGCLLYHPDRGGKLLAKLRKGREVAELTPPALSDDSAGEASSDVFPFSEEPGGSNPPPSDPYYVDPDPNPNQRGRRLPIIAEKLWDDRLAAEERIKEIVAELKTYCTRPAYTHYVRTRLNQQIYRKRNKPYKPPTKEILAGMRARALHASKVNQERARREREAKATAG
jgi:hypothetical protein